MSAAVVLIILLAATEWLRRKHESGPPVRNAERLRVPAPSGPQLDWAAIVAELQAMAEDQLGDRARKVKDLLGAADPSIAGIEAAIDQVPRMSLLFVDSSRLEQLAQQMRSRVRSRLSADDVTP